MIGILVCILYLTVLANMAPYCEPGDNTLQQVSSTQILLTLLTGLAFLAKDAANPDGGPSP